MGSLPIAVERFIIEQVRSVLQLEVLMLLFGYADRTWDGQSVATKLKRDPKLCAECLSDLRRRGFVRSNESTPDSVRYEPRPWVDQPLTLLNHLYPRHWSAVVTLFDIKVASQAKAVGPGGN